MKREQTSGIPASPNHSTLVDLLPRLSTSVTPLPLQCSPPCSSEKTEALVHHPSASSIYSSPFSQSPGNLSLAPAIPVAAAPSQRCSIPSLFQHRARHSSGSSVVLPRNDFLLLPLKVLNRELLPAVPISALPTQTWKLASRIGSAGTNSWGQCHQLPGLTSHSLQTSTMFLCVGSPGCESAHHSLVWAYLRAGLHHSPVHVVMSSSWNRWLPSQPHRIQDGEASEGGLGGPGSAPLTRHPKAWRGDSLCSGTFF